MDLGIKGCKALVCGSISGQNLQLDGEAYAGLV